MTDVNHRAALAAFLEVINDCHEAQTRFGYRHGGH